MSETNRGISEKEKKENFIRIQKDSHELKVCRVHIFHTHTLSHKIFRKIHEKIRFVQKEVSMCMYVFDGSDFDTII